MLYKKFKKKIKNFIEIINLMKKKPMKFNKYIRFCIRLLIYFFSFTGFDFIAVQSRFHTSKAIISEPSKTIVCKSYEELLEPYEKFIDPIETEIKQEENKILRKKTLKKLRQQLLMYEGNLTLQEKKSLHYLRKKCPEGIVRRYLEWRLYRPNYISFLDKLEVLLQFNEDPSEQDLKDFKKHISILEADFLDVCLILRKQEFIIAQIDRENDISGRLEPLFHYLESQSATSYINFANGLKTLQQKAPGLENTLSDFFEMTFIHHWFKLGQKM